MVQTDLKSDNLCGINQAAAPFYWIMDPVQVNNGIPQYNVGEVGVPTGVGLHTPSELIGISNLLSDRGNFLSSCNPPQPSMLSPYAYESDSSILGTGPPLEIQGMGPQGPQGPLSDRDNESNKKEMNSLHMNTQENFQNEFNGENKPNYSNYIDKADGQKVEFNERKHEKLTFLLPEITHQKGAAKDLSAVDWQAGFSGNQVNLFTNPQDLTHIIERMWLERGGVDQNQVIKQSQEPFTRNTHEDFIKNGNRATSPTNLNGQEEQIPTCAKIRQPYNTKFPFGIPPIHNGVEEDEHSEHFNAIDIASLGISSPQLNQNTNLPFNYDAVYNNGGCNPISFLNNKMCFNENNDLTGVNAFNFGRDLPPPGLNPITIM